jgi:hypothetical protein
VGEKSCREDAKLLLHPPPAPPVKGGDCPRPPPTSSRAPCLSRQGRGLSEAAADFLEGPLPLPSREGIVRGHRRLPRGPPASPVKGGDTRKKKCCKGLVSSPGVITCAFPSMIQTYPCIWRRGAAPRSTGSRPAPLPDVRESGSNRPVAVGELNRQHDAAETLSMDILCE